MPGSFSAALVVMTTAVAWLFPSVLAGLGGCESSKTFGHRVVSSTPGSSPVQKVAAPAASISDCLLLCSLNRLLQCRSVCFQPPGLCIMYSQSGSGFNYQLSTSCQLVKMYRTDEYPSCREVWVGDRRFCVLQQRVSASVNFNRPWVDYENGFGDANNFWTGLKVLNELTTSVSRRSSFGGAGATVRFEMTRWSGSQYYCEYDGFRVGSASTNYRLNYTRYASERSNVDTDGLQERSLGMMFSTMDRDNDLYPSVSCSIDYGGGSGWWFNACFYTNPNGLLVSSEMVGSQYISWFSITGGFISLKSTRIMILME